MIGASLAGHLVHDLPGAGQPARDRPWRLDPIPLVLDGEVFDELAARVTERLLRVGGVARRPVRAPRFGAGGLGAAEALSSSPRYRLAAVGAPAPPRWLTSYAVDVVELADGSWRVVQDLADTPTGVGFALIDRAVMARVAAELLGPEGSSDLASISGFPAELRHALAATSKVASPRIVVFTGGIDEPAYVEHSSLARLLGFHLVEAPDLVVRKGRLWLRTLGGLDPIDVVYRRLADAAVDPIEVSATNTTGVPGLLFAATEGGVVLANAHGCGVVEDPTLAPYWPAAVEGLTGVRLGLPLLEPGAALATVPAFRESRIGAAPAVIRLHAVAGPDGVTVMAGGNGRVLRDGDDPRRPTARLAKDVWVLGADRAAPPVVAPLPQVDLVSSVPTRAADAMFWLGRAAERAEAVAKTARVVASRRQTIRRWRRTTVGAGRDGWPTCCASCAARRSTWPPSTGARSWSLDAELVAATRAVSERLTALLAEAGTVAEYLSVTAGARAAQHGRVAQRLRRRPRRHRRPRRVHRRPRRVHRALGREHRPRPGVALRGPRPPHRALVGRARPRRRVPPASAGGRWRGRHRTSCGSRRTTSSTAAALEVLLAANESLVAYRRHHRSDVEPDAATHLLLHDLDNPRSYLASVGRLAEHVAAIDWTEGARPSPASPASSTTATSWRGSARRTPRSRTSARSSSRRGSRRR